MTWRLPRKQFDEQKGDANRKARKAIVKKGPPPGILAYDGGTAIGWNGVFLAEVARIAGPAKAGQLTGATAVFTFAGPMLGPSLFSLILLLTSSYAAAFCTMGVFTAIGGALLLRDAHHEHARLRQQIDSAL